LFSGSTAQPITNSGMNKSDIKLSKNANFPMKVRVTGLFNDVLLKSKSKGSQFSYEFDQQFKAGRNLSPAGVVDVIAGPHRGPILKDQS